jgi:ribosomal protein S12 methylthiotransferase accessory factor
MMRQPKFKPCFRCEIVPSEGVFLLAEKEHFLLRGDVYIQLAPLLDGKHTLEEIIDTLEDTLSFVEVFYLLDRLQSQGYITDADPSVPAEKAAFWEMLKVEPEIAEKHLQETTVSVVPLGEIDTEPFKAMLASVGVKLGENGDRTVVLTDDYLQEDLEKINQEALQNDRPWMLVKPLGTEIWIGPIFIPGKTGCWECLAHRLRSHRQVENYLQNKKNTASFPTSLSALPSTLATAYGIAATELAKWIACDRSESLESNIITLNALSLEKRHHFLVQRPQCPCCGNPQDFAAKQSAPIALSSRKKSFTRDGGHRCISPEQTLKNLEHHVSPITGIISILQRISTWEEENGLTTSYRAGYGLVGAIADLNELQGSLRSESYGKGKSDTQAKVSALSEAIERYSIAFQGDEARIRAKLKDLEGVAIHPNTCMLYSEKQFSNREQLNSDRIRFNSIPEPFNEEVEIEWSPAWSLTYNAPRYIPTAYCYSGYSQKYHAPFAVANSNGCAAGNYLEEAILQGFMELVERDSIALWWYNRLKKPGADLSSFEEPYFQEIEAHYKTLQRDLWVLDLTSDLNIPVFAAISRRNDREEENIIMGFGAHFDPQIALLRALTELNQSLPAAFFGILDPKSADRDRDREAIEWWKSATVARHPYLLPDKTIASKTPADYLKQWSDDFYTDVMNCVEIARTNGLETIVLDQSRPDLGLSVVKVIVPGLRHFWPRFAPGRLYDVPVKMGWSTKALTEEILNPLSAFF